VSDEQRPRLDPLTYDRAGTEEDLSPPRNGWQSALDAKKANQPLPERVLSLLRGWPDSGRQEGEIRTSLQVTPEELRPVLVALVDSGQVVVRRMATTVTPKYLIAKP
jgi:hypothetical protein